MAIVKTLRAFLGAVRKRLMNSRFRKTGRYLGGASLGQSLVIIAIAFLGIIAFVGFVVDTGIIYLHRVWLGQAVDAASLAAGYELPNIKGACARAVEYLQANGYETGLDFNFQIIYPSRPDAPNPPGDPGEFVIDAIASGIDDPSDCASVSVPAAHNDMHYEVEVFATQQVSTVFMHLLGFGTVGVTAPSTSERSARFDVVLVLDRSGSMDFDSCSLIRPAEGYGCQNRYNPCTAFYSEDFEAYDTIEDVQAAGWVVNGGVKFMKTAGTNSIELRRYGTEAGAIYRTISTVGYSNVALFLKARNVNLPTGESMIIQYRPNPGVGWSQIAQYSAQNMPNEFVGYAVMLPSAAYNNPTLQVRISTTIPDPKRLEIDDIELRTCTETVGTWIWYKWHEDEGCSINHPTMTCQIDDPNTLLPGVSIQGNLPPMAQLMEQPMLDVLRSSADFIDILDSRVYPGQPREDQIGLVTFNGLAYKLRDLTTDYEDLKEVLYSDIYSIWNTNIGGGIRIGLSVLGEGRQNSTHFMILLTDGWPNRYDSPYINPTQLGIFCSLNNGCMYGLEMIDAQAEAAAAQNVTIFTIGLGADFIFDTYDASGAYGEGTENFSGWDLLNRIATTTGGAAYYAPSTAELEQIFQWIAEAIFVRLTE